MEGAASKDQVNWSASSVAIFTRRGISRPEYPSGSTQNILKQPEEHENETKDKNVLSFSLNIHPFPSIS